MKISQIIAGNDLHHMMRSTLNKIHLKGPTDLQDFELLSYAKKFHGQAFAEYESTLIYLLGLFYKVSAPSSFMEEMYSIFADAIQVETERRFTPVQADAFKRIDLNTYFSFSAPTSAGKSYLFREVINEVDGDIVIVVPSRALIAEYIFILNNLVRKDVMILQFIEIVNIARTRKRIFVITPERGVELFKNLPRLNVELFLFDEAQISEEYIRGMRFDSFVRRVDRYLPNVKKVFTHPFILNPEAQLRKHNFRDKSDSQCYQQNAVGKIYLTNIEGKFSYFSPFSTIDDAETILAEEDIVEERLKINGTVLIYTSKLKIYDGSFLLDFAKYIDLCEKITDPEALKIVEELREYIGASSKGTEKHSHLIEMMERGVVIHHGSIPLKARLLIERFVNANYAKICFSTSTLIQGINMPFDIVWINNFYFTGTESHKTLDLKNLIGRAGRSTQSQDKFDFGYVIIENENVRTFKRRLQDPSVITATSNLDEDIKKVDLDLKDIVEAIKDETFDDSLQLTNSQVDRLSKSKIDKKIEVILDNLLIDNVAVKGRDYYALSQSKRTKIKSAFKDIYIAHLRRKKLTVAEQSVLSASIPMLLWQIQGKSFAEIVSLRHAFLTQKDEQRAIIAKVRSNQITAKEGADLRRELKILFSQMAAPLPDQSIRKVPLFRNESVLDLDYDKLVYDTYDYLDKVISQCLSDPLSAAFLIYFHKTGDTRSQTMSNYIKYGTNDQVEIWLLKYGFSFEDIEWLKEHIAEIDENQITFLQSVEQLDGDQFAIIEKFL